MTRIRTLLVANRGEIARRVMRTARGMGIRTVAVYSQPDARSPHIGDADLSVAIGGTTSAESYLDGAKILHAVAASGADAVHPGYGFLSENADFAQRCADAGVLFVGPAPDTIRQMGLKNRAKEIARTAGVPVLPDTQITGDAPGEWAASAQAVGFPLLVKAVAGGGGKGMRLVRSAAELADAVAGARREAGSSFGNAAVFLERYLEAARHIEIQVFGDTHGSAVHLGERECSIQRRHQKVLEEAPSPVVGPQLRERMGAAAVSLVQKLGYLGAGTVEYLLDDRTGDFFFLEMNTRLQVEHPVTEEVTGLDLVALQLRVAQGESLGLDQASIVARGHAIEVRLYAEDPAREYLPAPGPLYRYTHPDRPGLRFEDGVAAPGEVPPFYDPMLAKVVAHAATRAEAAAVLAAGLDATQVHGTVTNRAFLAALLRDLDFLDGATRTDFLDLHPYLLDPAPATPPIVHLAAAVAVCAARRRTGDALRDVVRPGFRLLAAPLLTPAVWRAHDDESVSLRYRLEDACGDTSLVLEVDDEAYQFALFGLGTEGVRVRYEDVEHRCTVAAYADGSLWVNDVSAQSAWYPQPRLPEAASSAAATGLGPVAAMPGTVVDIAVQPGQPVTAGQTLVVLEAMKMEHPTLAQTGGVVEAVHVTLGQYVAAQTVLVTLIAEPAT